jgi:hypothetical protein
MEQPLKPVILKWGKVVQSDLIVQWAIMFPLIFLGFIIVLNIFGGLPGFGRRGVIDQAGGTNFFMYALMIALVIGVPLLIWRVLTIRKVFSDGVETTGTIMGIAFNKDRGRVKWAYQVGAEKFTGSSFITKTNFTRTLAVGHEVAVLVQRDAPKNSLLRDLYT